MARRRIDLAGVIDRESLGGASAFIPTFEQAISAYRKIVEVQRARTGKPCERYVKNAICNLKRLVEDCGLNMSTTIDKLMTNDKMIRDWSTAALIAGMKTVTVRSMIDSIRAVFAKWTITYYSEMGFIIPNRPSNPVSQSIERYSSVDDEQMRRVKEWYKGVGDKRMKCFACLMLNLAVRTGDALRMTRGNFSKIDGRTHLVYTPNKTKNSSKRRVCWPVADSVWRVIDAGMPESGSLGGSDWRRMRDELNAEMRKLGFDGSKGSYELRKICIDYVYKHHGAEMAVSISGDDIKTILKHYADPSSPHVNNLEVVK